MTDRKKSALLEWALLLLVANAHAVIAQETLPVYDSDIDVKSFEQIAYPPIPRQARIEGTVVILAKLDGDGRVISTSAISGARLLIPDTLSNAKKWRFASNTNGLATIIYEFRLVDGKCNGKASRFTFHKPNRALVTACEGTWQP